MITENSKNIKNLDIILYKNNKAYRTVNIQEKDRINLKYKDDSGKIKSGYGYLLKIGVDQVSKKNYITILLYNYINDDNVIFIYTDKIVDIMNINRSKETYSISSVYCADESVVLLKSTDDSVLEFSKDGKKWNKVGSGGGGGSDSLYDMIVSRGYKGTKEELADLIVELFNNKENIVTREIEDL